VRAGRCWWLLLGLVSRPAAAEAPARHAPVDPTITAIVREISARNIEASVRKLAGFHTRHTLSETESDARGVGAARRWIQAELERYAAEAGGRLEVTLDETTAGPSPRIPRPTRVVTWWRRCRARSPKPGTASTW
jgi:hypothetical protein